MTSDSVNLGSNPSPPATAKADVSGSSCGIPLIEQLEFPERKAHDGRTEPGTRGWVYFISDGEAIKIGFSVSPYGRAKALQTGHHRPLTVLAKVPARIMGEAELHQKFKHLRIRREWFRPEPDLLAFIEDIKNLPVPPRRRPIPPLSDITPLKNPKQARTWLRRLADEWPDHIAVTNRVTMACESLKSMGRDPDALTRIAPKLNRVLAELHQVLKDRGEYIPQHHGRQS